MKHTYTLPSETEHAIADEEQRQYEEPVVYEGLSGNASDLVKLTRFSHGPEFAQALLLECYLRYRKARRIDLRMVEAVLAEWTLLGLDAPESADDVLEAWRAKPARRSGLVHKTDG